MTNVDFLVEHVKESIIMSDSNISGISKEIIDMPGMSGTKTRHLYNNICNLSKDYTYFEVGTWLGSSFISANYKNQINSIACDNWAEFGGRKEQFLKNFENLCSGRELKFIEKDCFNIDQNDLTFDSIDIYLYDGCHKYTSHKSAITHFSKFLKKYSIVIIDDWRSDGEWSAVENGTYDGFYESKLEIIHVEQRFSKQEHDGSHNYWNGVGIFVCEKKV